MFPPARRAAPLILSLEDPPKSRVRAQPTWYAAAIVGPGRKRCTGTHHGLHTTDHVGRRAGREGGAPGRGADRWRYRPDGGPELRSYTPGGVAGPDRRGRTGRMVPRGRHDP